MMYGFMVSFDMHVMKGTKEHGKQGCIDMCIEYTNNKYTNV